VRKKSKVPWVMRLPGGLREQPAWIYIGALCTLAGLSYLLGFAESNTITQVLAPVWLRVWGGFLLVSGALVGGSTWFGNKPLERLSLRFLSLCLLVYMGWILAAVPFNRATLTVTTVVALVGLSEIRVAVLKMVLRSFPISGEGEEDTSWEE
jgi:hypothetical protein